MQVVSVINTLAS